MTTAYTLVTSPRHAYPNHPERPARLDQLQLAHFSGLREIPAQPASLEDLLLVHTPEMLDTLKRACDSAPAIVDSAPTFVTPSSWDDALLAAGGVLGCARAIVRGEVGNAFAIVRPPGHHAEPHRAMGFCLFSNAAIAARAVLSAGLRRVAVIDFDVHHGNGTQAALVDEHRAGFFSSHQEGIYPGTGWSTDLPNARGRMINVPLPAGTGDNGFRQMAESLLTAFVRNFHPDMLVISAGYDAHWRDPLASLSMTTNGYYALSQKLAQLAREYCQGRILFILEGGYDPRNVANGIHAGLAALTGQPLPAIQDACPYDEPDVEEWLAEIYKWHFQ